MPTPSPAFAAIERQYLALISADPNACVELGLDQALDQLPVPSLARASEHAEQADALLAAIEALDQEVDFDAGQDLELMALTARQIRFQQDLRFNGRPHLAQLPKAGEIISSGIFLLVSRDPRPAEQRLDDILGRLRQVPRFLEQMLTRLDHPVARWVQIDLDTLAELPEFFQTIANWADEVSYPRAKALGQAIIDANAAMTAYAEALAQLPTTNGFAIGAEAAQQLVTLSGVEQSLDTLHGFAVDFTTRTRQEIGSLHQRLVTRYDLPEDTDVPALQAFLNKRFAVAVPEGRLEAVIERYQGEADKVEAFIRERDLFPLPDDQAMTILRTPGFMAPMIPAGAMLQPAALRAGTKESQIYLTLSEELLDEHTELGIPVMMVHEGVPGHHLQLASACGHASTVRRVFPAMELAEGWTTMLEDYMLDQGYLGELEQEARFIAKLDISRIAARVAIDLYFMTGQARYLQIGYDVDTSDADPFINAGRLLKAVTGFTDGRVQAELNWYSQERGYPLCYLTGNTLVWQLKQDFVRRHQDRLPPQDIDRLFHRRFLEAGNLPMAMLRRRFAHYGWI